MFAWRSDGTNLVNFWRYENLFGLTDDFFAMINSSCIFVCQVKSSHWLASHLGMLTVTPLCCRRKLWKTIAVSSPYNFTPLFVSSICSHYQMITEGLIILAPTFLLRGRARTLTPYSRTDRRRLCG